MRSGHFGYLLPILAVIVNQLNALLEDTTNPLPLINGLRAGTRRRFDDMNNDAQLAAVVLPQFKLYWLSGEVQKALVTDVEVTLLLQNV